MWDVHSVKCGMWDVEVLGIGMWDVDIDSCRWCGMWSVGCKFSKIRTGAGGGGDPDIPVFWYPTPPLGAWLPKKIPPYV